MAEMKKRYPKEVIEHWLLTIQNEGRGLNDWERHFCASLRSQLDQGRGISEVQEEKLEQIYAAKTA